MIEKNIQSSTLSSNKVLKVGFNYKTELSEFDPARVQVAGQYAFLEHLYLPLILKDNHGTLAPACAKSFRWVDDEVEFEMRDDLRDKDGIAITVEDAYFSVMRLLVLGTSTHGDLSKLLCGDVQPSKIEDGCAGVRILDGKLRLKPRVKNLSIFDSLTTIDFSIVPRRSVDAKHLDKIDLSITSGPYFVDHRDDKTGSITLKLNPYHYMAKRPIPREVVFIRNLDPSKTGLDYLEDGTIDFLPTIDQTDISERIERYSNRKDFELHVTLPVRLELLVFTEKGLKLPPERRWAIARKIRSYWIALRAGKTGFSQTSQYYPDAGAGSLSESELGDSRDHLRNAADSEKGSQLLLGCFARWSNTCYDLVAKILPEAGVKTLSLLPSYDPNNDVDFYLVSMDTGFLEDLPNVVNTVKSGFFGLTSAEREDWISKYLTENDDSTRVRLLKDMHKRSLDAPLIVPLVRSPYVSVLRRPYKSEFSELYPNVPLWQILTR